MPEPEMSTLVQVGVAYTSDLERVERITIEVGKRIQETVEGGVKDFTPLIRFHTFADSNINFTVVLRVRESVAQYAIKHEFIKALKKRYDEEGIEISWPVRKIFRGAE
jgi:small-conductance mechanosensitive channel